jgi:hypothetical protein
MITQIAQPPPATRLVKQEHLDLIIKGLDRVLDNYTLDFENYDMRDRALDVLERVQIEITTLRANPQSFADQKTYVTYFANVGRKTHQIMETIRLHTAREKMDEEMAELRHEENYRVNRPSYVKELINQPWQQFLHPEAPGWPMDLNTPPGVTSHQIIPNGGIRILAKWEKEVKEIYEFLDNVSVLYSESQLC